MRKRFKMMQNAAEEEEEEEGEDEGDELDFDSQEEEEDEGLRKLKQVEEQLQRQKTEVLST